MHKALWAQSYWGKWPKFPLIAYFFRKNMFFFT
jgi:hypothetical protein